MHSKESNLDELLAKIAELDERELDRLQEAIDRRRGASHQQSAVLERRDYRNGILQLETRAYTRKNGEQIEQGPYWYFHYREGGRQRTLYIGKTDDPEAELEKQPPEHEGE